MTPIPDSPEQLKFLKIMAASFEQGKRLRRAFILERYMTCGTRGHWK